MRHTSHRPSLEQGALNFVDIAPRLDYVKRMSSPLEASPAVRSRKVLIGMASAIVLATAALTALLLIQERSETNSIPAEKQLPDFNQTKVKAEGGDPEAQNALGEIYAEGKQVPLNYSEAVQWYRKAAEKGLAKAQYNLAVLCDIGQGVAKNESEAAEWYRKAAEQGDPDAQYTLASMYGLGRGVPHDPKEALRWYHRAAEQGDALARFNLAERYERGKDVAQDLVEAYKWHCLAAERGLKDAAAARESLEHRMTSQQLAEARKRIRDFEANQTSPATAK